MSRIVWRWEEKDFGFRFRSGKGARANEYYQAAGRRVLRRADQAAKALRTGSRT